MTYDEFYAWICAMFNNQPNPKAQRLGQMYYNNLPEDIAQRINGTLYDPFHLDTVIHRSHDRVRELWGESREFSNVLLLNGDRKS